MYSQQELLTFASLMTGAKEFYGTTVVGEIKDGKAESTSTCIHEPPSPAILAKHLAGEQSIGLSPLKADNTIEFGAIDIDDYKGDLMNIVRAIWDFDMPICPCYSKSKKLHLYFFFEQGTNAKDAVEVMRWYARAFACNKKVEVFPKQVERSISNKAYSWINLPYFNANDISNHRKMVARDGSILDLIAFCDRAKACKITLTRHKEHIERYPCFDAPPCILTGAILRDIGSGGRNNWLFSAAVYFKLKDENCDLEEQLTELNNSLQDPLEEQEIKSTILSSLNKRTYFYMCDVLDNCDKLECKKGLHGMSSVHSTGLEYGTFTQLMTDPPTYTWSINGQLLKFDSEKELLGQSVFREQCLRKLHLVPRPLPDADWSKIVNKAARNVVIDDSMEGQGNDFTVGSRFFDLVCKYFGESRRAQNISQVRLGRVWVDEDTKEYVFLAWNLVSFMKETNNFKAISDLEMRRRIIDMGARKDKDYWRLPTDSIPTTSSEKIEIDFNLHEGESNDF